MKARKSTVRELLHRLESGNVSNRRKAAEELRFRRGAEKSALPALFQAAEKDADERVRVKAVWAVGDIASRSSLTPRQIRILRRFLHGTVEERGAAAMAFGTLGKVSRDVVRDLVAAASDDDGMLRARAISALGRLKSHRFTVITALLDALRHSDSRTRRDAVQALRNFVVSSKKVRMMIERALEDVDSDVRYVALCALSECRSLSPSAALSLVRIMSRGGASLSTLYAARLLLRFGDSFAISAIQKSWG